MSITEMRRPFDLRMHIEHSYQQEWEKYLWILFIYHIFILLIF